CILSMPCTVENCASWPRNSAFCSGLSGSWFLSCSVMSRRKSAWPSEVSRAGACEARPSEPHGFSRLVPGMVLMAWCPSSRSGSLAHVQGRGGQFLGGVGHLHVGLVAARGGDQGGHLRDRGDVGRVDVAVAIGQRVAGLVALDRRGGAVDHLGHPHARQRRVARYRLGGEHRMLGLVHGVGVARHGVGVGQVAGDGAQAHRLGVHRRAGDVEDRERAHRSASYCPVIAVNIPRTLASTNDSDARYSSDACANAAFARSPSTVLPSRLGWREAGAYCEAATAVSMASPGPTGCNAARSAVWKSRSCALKPGVSALAMLPASNCSRCSRRASAVPWMPRNDESSEGMGALRVWFTRDQASAVPRRGFEWTARPGGGAKPRAAAPSSAPQCVAPARARSTWARSRRRRRAPPWRG